MENKGSEQSLTQKIKNLNRIQKIVLWSAAALILYTILGFLVLPPILKIVLEKKLPEALHRPFSIQKIKINPYTLTATLEGLAIRKQDDSENFIGFDRLFVNLQIVSIFKRALIIKSVALTGPKVNFTRNKDLTYSFSDLIAEKSLDAPQQEQKRPFLFSIHNIEIKGGAIKFQDLPKDKIHRIAELNLAIPDISNLSYDIETYVMPAFSAAVNNTKVSMGGMTKPFADTQEVIMDIDFNGLNIPEYFAYVPNPTKLTLQSGIVDINARLSYLNRRDNTSKLALTGLVSIQDIDVTDDQGAVYIRLPHIAITMADSNLLEKQIRIANLTLKDPELRLERLSNNDILPISLMMTTPETNRTSLEEKIDDNGGTPFEMTIDEILLENGNVMFSDGNAQPFTTTLTPINVKMVNFSTIPEQVAEFDVAVRTESEESISLKGNLGLSPLLVEGNADIKAIKLTKYAPYLKKILIPDLADGKIDISTDYHYSSRDSATETRLSNLALTVSDFVLKNENTQDTIISLPRSVISNSKLDLEEKSLTINNFYTQGADIFLLKDKDGRINLADMIRLPEKENDDASAGPPAESGTEKARSWLVNLDHGKIEKYSLTMRDMGPATSAVTKIDDLDMTFSDLSTAQNSRGGLSFGFRLNEAGEISGKGGLGLVPLSASLDLDIKNLGLKPLQPYIGEQINIVITSGAVSVNGNLELNQQEQEGVVIRFNGNSRLSDLAIVDAFAGEDLLGLKNLSLTGVYFSSQPQSLAIKDISLQDIFAKLIVAKDGTLNLATLKRSEPEVEQKPETETSGEKPDRRIEIGSISVKGGRVDFLDRKITPDYSAVLDELDGKITGISTQEEAIADVQLAGKLNKHSPLNVTGKIAPLKDELFADLKIDFHDIDLSPTSPYTGKYIAYKTDKGKLTLNLHYIINGKALNAENYAFLDQFTLGDSVESPDAASLPVHLAISLLKNRKGEIHLNVPVQGDLDDPEFSVGGVIVKVIFGLIAKAATSPFALLGALIPDGEDLQHVTFGPGLSDISRDASGKLEKMAGVLYERPGLRVDIIGRVEPARDRDALIKMRFDRLINLQKLHELSVVRPEETPQIETIEITTEEYPRYLSRAYEAVLQAEIKSKGKDYETDGMLRQFPILKKFSLNRSVFGRLVSKMSSKDKPLTPEEHSQLEEMEKLLKAWIKVSDEDLRLLAIQRAENVLGFLLEKGPVEAERLFIVEPQVEPAEDADEKMTGMQVEMVIK